MCCFFFKAEDGIRDLVRSRGLGDVYKRQVGGSGLHRLPGQRQVVPDVGLPVGDVGVEGKIVPAQAAICEPGVEPVPIGLGQTLSLIHI